MEHNQFEFARHETKLCAKKKSLVPGIFMLFCFFVFGNNTVNAKEKSFSLANDIADWTIMIYMNGDNNLEPNALDNFADMARVGSTDRVNIIVQFDRNGRYRHTSPNWSQTLRFRVERGMQPLPRYAVQDIGEANMGDGATLRDFTIWAMNKYPAKHYMLDIWDHGQGWRLEVIKSVPGLYNQQQKKDEAPSDQNVRVLKSDPFRSSSLSPVKSCSFDESSNDELYNREIVDSLFAGLGGKKIDVIGFDCCLMAMIETVFGMRGIGNVFVGSEELEPGTGWQYDDWLQKLVNDPGMDSIQLGRVLVDSYRERYDTTQTYYLGNPTTTLSAVNLNKVAIVADDITRLSNRLISLINVELQAIEASRKSCRNFAPNPYEENPPKDYFYHIDFTRFCDKLIENAKDSQLISLSKVTKKDLSNCIIVNYSGVDRGGDYGSKGLAIYFPPSQSLYKNDVFAENGYEKSNKRYPVEFVQKISWTDFLHAYFKRVP